ncbi:ExeM/NucH family extracellular endonuclease [Homoserinimonas sp. OAct 916]|uniref:ExeM/NucH family extracellular endonuclease n=1 Tax=Homoserinimonas sp. OAct 916 TaxID=2211450 RepID=UPI000DBE5EF1|nr:ExeM/NucH family extracellular endonuclease [Homoserinimonas sp. OAct 916]
MSHSPRKRFTFAFASILGFAMVAAPIVALPAVANTDGTGVVINEVYLKGGSANAYFNTKFIELYNPGTATVSLDGWSIQSRSATNGSATVRALSGEIKAESYFLIGFPGNGTPPVGDDIPKADLTIAFGPSGTTGIVLLANTNVAVPLTAGSVSDNPNPAIVDLIGYGAGVVFEGAAVPVAGGNGEPNSLTRTNFKDTDNNAADFSHQPTVTPTNSAGVTVERPEPTPPAEDLGEKTIAEIQGQGAESAFAGDIVTTRGVVTASYPTGGFNGFYIQTPGTGGPIDFAEHKASDGLFIYSSGTNTVDAVSIGDYVEVTGTVSEFAGMTQVTPTDTASVSILNDAFTPVAPTVVGLPETDAQRETLEGMLVAPAGDFTVTDTYSTNQYAEVKLAAGATPLVQPTAVAAPSVAAYTAAMAANNARTVSLDDGASTNFLPNGNGGNKNIPLPYVSNDTPVRVGAAVEFTAPVIFDYRNNAWKYQPTQQLTPANAADVQPVTFEKTRQDAPKNVGGDLKLATFNVLNYFTTTGDVYTAAGRGTCTTYNDRNGVPITVNSCTGNGPRGAATADSLKRQEDKIVSALSALDADVIGLEEIEASTSVGGTDRDAALKTLVAALNTKAGSAVWAHVPSPPAGSYPTNEDVIRTAFIYKKDVAELVGDSTILMGSDAFANAREPLAQAFKLKGAADADAFVAIVNHFKSKGSGSGAGNTDAGDGQGASNADRVSQATALVAFAADMATASGTDKTFLLGDFNSYLMEDPINVIQAAGYVDQGSKTAKHTYSFGGMVGSLDHVFASPAADATVNDVDIWNINSGESIALEYSRFNYNVTDFYVADMFRASDHDPVIVGLDLTSTTVPSTTVDLNLLNINDFHGRIDSDTVKFAGTIEQLRAQYPDTTLLGSAGDNIGASVFASAVQKDVPTIKVLNALDLESSVGNHEFDTGYPDLTGRIAALTNWTYLGANVYHKGTTDPALDEYTIVNLDGVKVAVIGAVTEETPSLVTQSGIAMLDFGDPVEAVNRVAAQLTDGDPSNGEADVVIAEYHEGASQGTADGGTLENQLALGGAFAEIVNNTSANVDVIFTGHTHKAYAWDGPIPNDPTHTRPILQTGSYGANIGQVVITYDTVGNEVVSYTARNVPRTTMADADLVATYPRVAEVKTIVDAALAEAGIIGNQPIGAVTKDITTAFIGTTRDDRGSESTLGNLVANSLVTALNAPDLGGAEIGIVNPGGLRAELLYGDDGVITYGEANGVLPFLNNLWTTTLTGAQFKQILEQQWQRTKDGVPITSRPFQNLGLSDNVSYTYDPARAIDDRVTSITVDGAPIDLAKDYRIGSFSFLLQGGDNFWEFNSATDTRDSGLIDRDAWIAYIEANSPLSPSFARHAVQVSGVPAGVLEVGATVTLDVSKLDLTSLGSPANTELAVSWAGSSATFTPVAVVNGAATVTVTVPADAAEVSELVLTAAPSGTVVHVPLKVQGSKTVDLNLLNINDFHGRIDANTVKFAGTIERLRAEYPDTTLLGSAGDNIGASVFASSVQQDVPTIKVLNALGLESSVGNHEFDTGYVDLTGRIADLTDWTYLGANVYYRGTTAPALPEYTIVDLDGVKVAVIGAVTEETPSLVSKSGIAMLDFGDPVEAVNRVAAKLSDGDLSNGEADVIIAEYHEGANQGSADGGTLENQVALGGAFAEIVNNTSAHVDVIFTAHTHKAYAWDALIPGQTTKTRPVLQTGSYGANIGQVVVTYDTGSDEVVSYTAKNVARTIAADADLVAAYPRVAEVQGIVNDALDYAAVKGSVKIGEVTADITTAFIGANRDDRGSESTLGNLVANSLLASLENPDLGGAEIGMVNPGGLRAELLYGTDGSITVAQANSVLPFLNNLWTTTLTGAQFKQVLEEQWQRNADGTTPSREYQQLGLSDNVSYTYDPARDRDDRITSITVNGAPIDMAKDYRIGSFSFLLDGGDNFWEFNNAKDTRDSGLIDRDAWMDYIETHSPLSPSFARHAVQVSGIPAGVLKAGATVTLDVSTLDLTSLESPANTELAVSWAGSSATFTPVAVVNGAATVTVTVPKDAKAKNDLVLTAAPSGTVVHIPLTVDVSAPDAIQTPGTVVITGMTISGSKLTAVISGWKPADATFSYQWYRDGKAVTGATGSTYTLGGADVGAKMTVIVTGKKTGYVPAQKKSAATSKVTWSPRITRIQGDDRYMTAINISRAGFRVAPVVFVVTGSDYPDALSTAPVAAMHGGPLLLTAKDSLPTAVANEIKRLKPSKIVVVGGTGAVSNTVLSELKKIASTERISGSDRFDTSVKVNTHAKYGFTTAAKAYVATGMTFPDALSASAAGAAVGAPVILVNGSAKSLDAGTKAELAKLKVKKTIIAGGTGVVTAGIANDLKAATGTTPDRRGGSDRYETSRLIGADVFAPAKSVYLATGVQFPDAMAGAVLAGVNKGPLYLAQPNCIPKATLNQITNAAPADVTLFGGTGALSDNVANLKACK